MSTSGPLTSSSSSSFPSLFRSSTTRVIPSSSTRTAVQSCVGDNRVVRWGALMDLVDKCEGAVVRNTFTTTSAITQPTRTILIKQVITCLYEMLISNHIQQIENSIQLLGLLVRNCGLGVARHIDAGLLRAMTSLCFKQSLRPGGGISGGQKTDEIKKKLKQFWMAGSHPGCSTVTSAKDPKLLRVKQEILYLLQLWSDAFMMQQDQVPAIFDAYKALRAQGVQFPTVPAEQRFLVKHAEGSPAFERGTSRFATGSSSGTLPPLQALSSKYLTRRQFASLEEALRKLKDPSITEPQQRIKYVSHLREAQGPLQHTIRKLAQQQQDDDTITDRLASFLHVQDQVERELEKCSKVKLSPGSCSLLQSTTTPTLPPPPSPRPSSAPTSDLLGLNIFCPPLLSTASSTTTGTVMDITGVGAKKINDDDQSKGGMRHPSTFPTDMTWNNSSLSSFPSSVVPPCSLQTDWLGTAKDPFASLMAETNSCCASRILSSSLITPPFDFPPLPSFSPPPPTTNAAQEGEGNVVNKTPLLWDSTAAADPFATISEFFSPISPVPLSPSPSRESGEKDGNKLDHGDEVWKSATLMVVPSETRQREEESNMWGRVGVKMSKGEESTHDYRPQEQENKEGQETIEGKSVGANSSEKTGGFFPTTSKGISKDDESPKSWRDGAKMCTAKEKREEEEGSGEEKREEEGSGEEKTKEEGSGEEKTEEEGSGEEKRDLIQSLPPNDGSGWMEKGAKEEKGSIEEAADFDPFATFEQPLSLEMEREFGDVLGNTGNSNMDDMNNEFNNDFGCFQLGHV